jgi:FkbM family methyltransferase
VQRKLRNYLRRLTDPVGLASAVLFKSGLASGCTMHVRDVRLRCYPSSMSYALWRNRAAFDEDCEFIQSYLRAGDVYVDVGANIGYLAIVAAKRIGETGRAYAFEADRRMHGFLRHNVDLNGLSNIESQHVGVGDGHRTVSLGYVAGDDTQTHVLDSTGRDVTTVKPLDEVLPSDLSVSLLKIDTEGYEAFVLKGAGQVLARTTAVYIECSAINFARYGYGSEIVLKLLTACGFVLYHRDGHRWSSITPEYTPRIPYENIVAVRSPADFAERLSLDSTVFKVDSSA